MSINVENDGNLGSGLVQTRAMVRPC